MHLLLATIRLRLSSHGLPGSVLANCVWCFCAFHFREAANSHSLYKRYIFILLLIFSGRMKPRHRIEVVVSNLQVWLKACHFRVWCLRWLHIFFRVSIRAFLKWDPVSKTALISHHDFVVEESFSWVHKWCDCPCPCLGKSTVSFCVVLCSAGASQVSRFSNSPSDSRSVRECTISLVKLKSYWIVLVVVDSNVEFFVFFFFLLLMLMLPVCHHYCRHCCRQSLLALGQ